MYYLSNRVASSVSTANEYDSSSPAACGLEGLKECKLYIIPIVPNLTILSADKITEFKEDNNSSVS
jgi:hypothetical protein